MGFFSRAAPAPEPVEKKEIDLTNAVYVPLEHPHPGTVSQPEVPNDKTVSDEEKTVRYNKVLSHFKQEDLAVPLDKPESSEKTLLTPVEKAWLTKECFLRYLRACNWNVEDAIKRLENSLVWRRSYGLSNGIYGKHYPELEKYCIDSLKEKAITPELVEHEALTGKQVLFGFDKGCRPCLYLNNGRENTKPSETQIQFLMFMIEATINFMPQGQDKLALCVDFKEVPEVGLSKKPMPSVKVGKDVLHILQYHYPERLGRALFINIPFVASVFLKLCWPFLDPYTKQKVSFDNPFSDFIPKDQLARYLGGNVNYQYDHDKYWKGLIEIGVSKQKQYFDRFFELGAKVGLSEFDLRKDQAVPQASAEEKPVDSEISSVTEKLGDVKVKSDEVQAAVN